ncbi:MULTISPECIES: hypothetical protein [unclassified Tatumella]|uniref:hypothetical protein n=1 Tax=unclassified Tatumella TaxID=2649542 RepID=UPI001BAEF1BC|nr:MULTISPECIES: hypothetical protein [unclassified Tatumella]MBS0878864.1 hypothetical protein [Tatumella sp. JGM82]MBS0892373.1 hypothetical protein [Tatumella sp. JGM94]MBS0903462.1 hypothetical protein [Tatumella sp. JGM100]
MTNSIGNVFSQVGNSAGVTGGASTSIDNYIPDQIKPDHISNDSQNIFSSLINFANAGTQVYTGYAQQEAQQGNDRSNQILESMNNKQISDALQSGTLQYQNDPYTMNQLKSKMAAQTSQMVDGQIQKNIQNGLYNTPEEMSQDAQKLRQDAYNQLLSTNGWAANDPHIVQGYTSNIQQRDQVLNQTQQTFTSNQIKQTKALTDGVSLNTMINNSGNAPPQQTADNIYQYIQNNRASSDDKMNMLQSVNSQLSKTPGGAAILQQLQSKQFDLYGQNVNYNDIYGKSGTDTFITQAGQSNYSYSKQNRDSWNDQLNQIRMTSDPNQALSMITQAGMTLNNQQPGQQTTAQQQQLEMLKQQVQEKLERQQLVQKAVFQKQAQSDNRVGILVHQYSNSASGNTTAITDIKGQTTNPQIGNFTTEDSVNAATQYYNSVVNNQNLTQEQKDDQIMTLAQNTPNGQGINVLISNKMSQASNEISSAGLTGSLDFTKTPQLNSFISMYKSDPSALAHAMGTTQQGQQLYSQIVTISGMTDSGIDPSQYIQGQQKINNMDQAQKQDLQTQVSSWQKNTRSNTTMPTISGLGWNTASSIFKNSYAATGNVDFATQQAGQWLNNNIKTFSNDNYTGGVINSSLKLTTDSGSEKIGQQLLDDKINNLVTQYPVLKGRLFVTNDNSGNIMIGDASGALKATTGQSSIIITRQELQSDYHNLLSNQSNKEKATDDLITNYQLRQNPK